MRKGRGCCCLADRIKRNSRDNCHQLPTKVAGYIPLWFPRVFMVHSFSRPTGNVRVGTGKQRGTDDVEADGDILFK